MEKMIKDVSDIHTFVICAYKKSAYLEDCILSIMKQSYKSNVIISTGTPNDYIDGLAQKYELKVMVNTNHPCLANDWNYAMKLANTSLVTLAHQDDIYGKDYTKKIVSAYESANKPIIFFSDYGELRNGKIVRNNRLLRIKKLMLSPLKITALNKSRFVRRRILSFGNAICCPAVTFVKKEIQEPLFQDNMKSNIDWQAWELLSRQKGNFVYLPEILMLHRIHEGSTTSELLENNARKEEDIYVFKKFWPLPIAKIIERIYQLSEKSNKN